MQTNNFCLVGEFSFGCFSTESYLWFSLLLFFFYHFELGREEGGGRKTLNVCSSGGNDRDMNKNAYSSHSYIIESFQISHSNGDGGENKRPPIKHMDNCTTRGKKKKNETNSLLNFHSRTGLRVPYIQVDLDII